MNSCNTNDCPNGDLIPDAGKMVTISAADLEEVIGKLEQYAEYLARTGSCEPTSQLLSRLRAEKKGGG